MNPTREQIAHTLQILENTMQMPEPVRLQPRNQSGLAAPEAMDVQRRALREYWLDYGFPTLPQALPQVSRNRALALCGLRVVATLGILALAVIGLCAVVERMVAK